MKPKEKIKNYMFSTKLGHFLMLVFFSVLIELVLLIIMPELFLPAVYGSMCTAFILSLTDDNEKWV